MPVRFSCGCGKALKVPDHFAGRKVKCPGCDQRVPVPQPEPEPSALPPGIVQFSCTCGQQMQAREEYAGQAAKCPTCGSTVMIPASSSAPATMPAMSSSNFGTESPQPEADWDSPTPRRRRGSFLTIMLGCATLFLFTGVGAGLFFFFLGSVPTDLAYVPDDAVMFVSVRLADVWANNTAKESLTEKMQDEIEEWLDEFALSPDDIERVTLVSRDPRQMEVEWIIVATKSGYNKAKIIEKMDLDEEPISYRSKNYHIKANTNRGFFPVNDDVFIVGAESSIKACIDAKPRTRNTGPLGTALKRAAAGHHLVAAMAPPRRLVEPLGKKITADNLASPVEEKDDKKEKDPLDTTWLRFLDTATFVADFDSSWKFRATLTFDSAETAGSAQRTFDEGVTLLNDKNKAQPDEQLKKQIEKILGNLSIDENGNAVTLETEFAADSDEVQVLLPLLPF